MREKRQKEAIILKGIASQINSMAIPTISELDKMLKTFGYTIYPSKIIDEMENEIYVYKYLIKDIKETINPINPGIVTWIDERLEEI